MKLTRVTKLILVRGIYAAHALAAIIYTSRELDTVDLIIVSACMFALTAETLFTIRKSSGEWKWFLPSVPIYLTVILWCVWKLEITLLENRTYVMNTTHDCVTSCEGFNACPPDLDDCPTMVTH
ncbi:uncharacterized protein LOC117125412 [Anneissia japonica]|uniref:uncharacterized protein LOC117125412 n=1 Tax=Anneissia japonica TaxID=1529436 RepID=UPI001425BAFA|nr:uncharacterized protein LOC117125412 [Anneissia japonica]